MTSFDYPIVVHGGFDSYGEEFHPFVQSTIDEYTSCFS